MDIVYHIGANCTDGDRLIRSVMRDVQMLTGHGIRVPGPGRYRRLLGETIRVLGTATPAPGTRDALLDEIIDSDEAEVQRLILSNPAFLCLPGRVFEAGLFYGTAEDRIAALHRLFDGDRITVMMAIRNPATFIPAVFAQAPAANLPTFLAGRDPRDYRWSDMIARVRAGIPAAVNLTVWCNEDTPFLWPTLLRRMTGLPMEVPHAGDHDLLSAIMTPDGMARYLSYMASHPGQTESQARRVVAAFLDKFAIPQAIEEEVDLPGWDQALVTDLSNRYDADLAAVAAIDGITFLRP